MATVAHRVGDAMVTRPVLHGLSTTVGQLRRFFEDDHVHLALLVDAGTLIGTVERRDLPDELDDRMPARVIASLAGRTIRPDRPVTDALAMMRRGGRRRLAVTTKERRLLGLLCLKASGLGFCSDAGVKSRAG
jgi:CBS domain-containing protein